MYKFWYVKLVCMLFLVLITLAFPGVLTAANVSDPARTAVQAMGQAAGGSIAITWSSATELVTFMSAATGQPIFVSSQGKDTPEGKALAFLSAYGAAFGLQSLSQVVVTKVQQADEVGMEHVRLQQVHKGIPVTAGELTVHLRDSHVIAVLAKTLPVAENEVEMVPSIPPAEALHAAQEMLAKVYKVTDAVLAKPELQIFNRGHLEGARAPTHLSWFIEATKLDLREFIWVDAHTGGVLLHFSQLTDALNRRIHNASNTSALPGTLVRVEGGPPTGDLDANAAYDFSGDTYNYYFTQHGRDSYDGAGGTLISTVHYCPDAQNCPFENAFWNGTQMVYGTGLSLADDVDAHELTHAVTEKSAHLFYYMQSGALNESFSDIFGETIDLTNGRGTDTAAVRWLMGEDVPGGALRNMMNPPAFGDPGKVSDSQFVCLGSNDPFSDAGGVHTNSGVPNHAYALMVDGGTYNGVTITGIGHVKAGKVQYRALTRYLVSGSNFLDNYNAIQQSCAELIGTVGITSADCAEVKKALDAVEMSSAPCGQPQKPPLCAPGQTVSTLFFDDLESGPGNWMKSPPTAAWFYDDSFATSGVFDLFGDDADRTSDSSIVLNRNFALPANARLQFNHSFDFEASFDGGVIEYSTNGGASWIDAGSLIRAGANYNRTLDSGNPLGGRQAFSAPSFGYTATQLNLSSLAGQNVRFRFRIGTDESVGGFGWLIDDVRLYQCTAGGPDLAGLNGGTIWYTTDLGNWKHSPGFLQSLVAGDFNGDGKGDLAGLNGGTIWVTTDLVNWRQLPGFLQSLVVGDFNGDGKADLAGLTGGAIWVTTDLVNWRQLPGFLQSLVVGDFNGDGKADLAGLTGGAIWVTTDLVNWRQLPGFLQSLVVGDFNGDGKADLAGLTGGAIWYTTDLVNWKQSPGFLQSLVAGDFNGDGKADLAGLNGGTIWYTTDLVNWKQTPGFLQSLVVGDFNSDGKADLAGLNGGTIWYTTDLVNWKQSPGFLQSLVVGDFGP